MTGSLRVFYLTFCLAIAMLAWMLGYGLALQLLFRDGRILEMMITTNPFAPMQQFFAYAGSPVLRKIALGAMAPAVLLAGIVAYAGLKHNSNPLGDAAFQDAMSLRRGKWFRKRGKIFGCFGHNLLRVDDDRHHLIIGPTRSGKGAGYVIPNALMHQGSMIVTDLKGEIFRSTAGYRRKMGSQVFLFAPGSENTHRYNPLDFIRTDRGNRTTDIQNIAAILVPENTESENSVWQATAQQVMAGAISYITESLFYEGRRNLGEVNSFFNCGVNLQALMKFIKEKEPYLSRFTLESFNAYIALSERAAASALLDIQKALRPFKNERIVAATSVSDIDLRAMKHRPISIYLAPSITDITLLKPLLSLFVQQAIDILTLESDPKSLPVYFLLDEFRQLKKMTEITTKLPYVAGYNIKMAFVIQDLKNLDEIYGETSRHSLLGNCGYQLILGANDQATAEYASRALGKRTIRYTSESRTIELMGLHRRTKIEQIRERDLMMPQEVRQMPAEKMVLLVEGQGAIYGDRLRYFEQSPFRGAERYASEHVPYVASIEYLPPAAVPATTADYADPVIVQPNSAGSTADDALVSVPFSLADEHAAVSADEPASSKYPKRLSDRTERMASLEARFEPAALKLKALIATGAAKSVGTKRETERNWSAIFDATVPDEIESDRPPISVRKQQLVC